MEAEKLSEIVAERHGEICDDVAGEIFCCAESEIKSTHRRSDFARA